MRKIFLTIIIVLAVLIVAGGITMSFFLGPIVKTGMETVGPKITQVSINVEAVDLSLLTGSAKIKNLVVGNPEGYKAPHAISVGSAAVGVNPLSVLSDKIVIRSVRVEAPEITFEGNPFSGNNLNTILKNVTAATKSGGPAATNAPAKAPAKPGKKLEVDDFFITGAKVNFNGVTLPLPDIHLTDLGKGSEGITAADLTRRILDALTSATIKAVASAATDVGKDVGKLSKDVGKSLGTNVSNLGKSLGSLFKKSTN
ncbi:MAG TPA: hypothetical protein VMB80_02605 [Candidatus Acidoferrum sp.]|nr:hypothetical protein [Candidatus Acidoferrum sp.]